MTTQGTPDPARPVAQTTTMFRVTAPHAVFGFVVDDESLRVVDCAPIGRRALMGKTFGQAIVYCHGRRWRTETVRSEQPT